MRCGHSSGMSTLEELQDFDRMQRAALVDAAHHVETSEQWLIEQNRIKEETRPAFLNIIARENPHSFPSHEKPFAN